MKDFIEHIIVSLLNRRRTLRPLRMPGVLLGYATGGAALTVPNVKRAEHVVILGRTGSGKSSLLRSMSGQDIEKKLGFVAIDLHAETFDFLLAKLSAHERRSQSDLSSRVVIVEPADTEWAVGINVLEAASDASRFVQVAEITKILKQRWQLDSFGARTEELLRNSLLALSSAGLTLIDLPLLLTSAEFRAQSLNVTHNAEVRAYFDSRFNQASDAMQAAWREPVLNKVTAFTADPQLRHLLGQRRSTVNLTAALDSGASVLLNLDKGRLGEQAATLGSLFLTKLKNAVFARRSRELVTIYADELQNLVAYDGELESVLSEARKFGCSFVSANQYLDQYPQSVRAAILSVGTHIFFQLSAPDADKVASFLGGSKQLQALLSNLPPRHFVVKSGHHDWQQGTVPTVEAQRTNTADLYERCRRRWAKRRTEIEADIQARQHLAAHSEVLDEWE